MKGHDRIRHGRHGRPLKVVRALCHRVMVMQHGNIVEEGPVNEVLSNPRTEYTQRLVRAAFEVAA